MSEHTPGPWHQGALVPTTVWGGTKIVSPVVALCCFEDIPEDTAIANAFLIAAAPDMLTALKTVIDHLHIAMNEPDANKQASAIIDAYDAASAGITKATGAAS